MIYKTVPNPAKCPACHEPEIFHFDAKIFSHYCEHFQRGAVIFAHSHLPEGRLLSHITKGDFERFVSELLESLTAVTKNSMH